MVSLCLLNHRYGKDAYSLNHQEKIIDVAFEVLDACGDEEPILFIRSTLLNIAAIHALASGKHALALEHSRQCVHLRSTALHPDYGRLCNAIANLGRYYGALGQFNESLANFKKAEEICNEHGKGKWLSRSFRIEMAIAQVHYLTGRYAEAKELLDASLPKAVKLGSWMGMLQYVR